MPRSKSLPRPVFVLLALGLALALAAPARGAEGGGGGGGQSQGQAAVLGMLKTNTVVKAAVAQGKRFSGSPACRYEVKATEPPQFEPNTTFDYTATIACDGRDSNARITVAGRLFSGDPQAQALKLSLDFAG